jgi:hypothetical protein
MAFNGSGVFVRLFNWATDKTNSVAVTASRMDSEMDGMATGLSTCITKDGQQTTTARIPFFDRGISDRLSVLGCLRADQRHRYGAVFSRTPMNGAFRQAAPAR